MGLLVLVLQVSLVMTPVPEHLELYIFCSLVRVFLLHLPLLNFNAESTKNTNVSRSDCLFSALLCGKHTNTSECRVPFSCYPALCNLQLKQGTNVTLAQHTSGFERRGKLWNSYHKAMPPKKKANEPSKKTELKKKEKVIEVSYERDNYISLQINAQILHFYCCRSCIFFGLPLIRHVFTPTLDFLIIKSLLRYHYFTNVYSFDVFICKLSILCDWTNNLLVSDWTNNLLVICTQFGATFSVSLVVHLNEKQHWQWCFSGIIRATSHHHLNQMIQFSVKLTSPTE